MPDTQKKVRASIRFGFLPKLYSLYMICSVRMALIYLGFADYFGMKAVIAKTVPFLLKSKLSESLLNEGLKMADRIPNNMAILVVKSE